MVFITLPVAVNRPGPEPRVCYLRYKLNTMRLRNLTPLHWVSRKKNGIIYWENFPKPGF